MKRFISAAVIVSMVVVSCTSKEDLGKNGGLLQQPSSDNVKVFSADFAEPITKVSPSYEETARTVTVLWDQDDKVGVYDADGAPKEFKALSSGVSTDIEGKGLSDVGTYYAMFPYDPDATISAGVISTSLPAEQVAAKDEFSAHLAVASTTGSAFSFQNVCALVRVSLDCADVAKIEFKGNKEEIVAGDINIHVADAGYTAGATTSTTVTVTPPSGESVFAKGSYYFSVLPQVFESGFTVTYVTSSGGTDVCVANGRVEIPRSTLVVGSKKLESYYIIGPAHNPNWTMLGKELVGHSKSGKSTWIVEDAALAVGEVKLIKAPGGAIDWNSGLGFDNGAISVSSSSTPMYLEKAGSYDIVVTYDESTQSFVEIRFVCETGSTVYSSANGISINGEAMPDLQLTGSMLASPITITYPYWFKPAEYYTLQNGATITVPSPASLAGMTADERYFKIEGNTITYVGPSGQRWTLNMSLRDKFLRMELPDRTMVAPDALWMTGANFRDAGSTGAYINWNTHLILRRVSEYSYECNVAIQNLNQTNPALFRIVGADGAAGWGLDTYQPVHFATPYPEAITDGGGGNFQSVDYGGVYRLTVDLSEGSGNYKMSFEKTGTL